MNGQHGSRRSVNSEINSILTMEKEDILDLALKESVFKRSKGMHFELPFISKRNQSIDRSGFGNFESEILR